MPTELRLGGFKELRRELATIATDLRDDSDPILFARARRSQAALASAYPAITGRLRAGVRIIRRVPRGIAAFYQLVSDAPYAHIFEFGSRRQRPRPTFLPISEADRRAAVVQVAEQVTDAGFVVRGERD